MMKMDKTKLNFKLTETAQIVDLKYSNSTVIGRIILPL